MKQHRGKTEASPPDMVWQIGTKLKRAIRKSGLTHYRLAKLAGVTATMIDRYMSGLSVRSDTIDRLCAVMYRGVKLKAESGITLEGAKHLISQRLSKKHGDDWILDHVDPGSLTFPISPSESVDGLLLVFRRRKHE